MARILPALLIACASLATPTAGARQFTRGCHLRAPPAASGSLLGSFTTRFKARNHRRAANVRRAGLRLDGLVIPARGKLSYNRAVGPRDEAHGFAQAPVIYNGKMVDQAGGGACQPSSTLHAAALVAGLSIVERSEHTWTSTYIAPGLDATVVWGRKDLVLRNPYPFPVRLHVELGPGWITTRVLGEQPRKGWVEIRTTVIQRRKHKVVIEVDPKMEPEGYLVGTFGIDGLRVARVRHFRQRGKRARTTRTQRLSPDTYYPRDEIVIVGEDGG